MATTITSTKALGAIIAIWAGFVALNLTLWAGCIYLLVRLIHSAWR